MILKVVELTVPLFELAPVLEAEGIQNLQMSPSKVELWIDE